jgi:hypothetical protein
MRPHPRRTAMRASARNNPSPAPRPRASGTTKRSSNHNVGRARNVEYVNV